MKCSSRSDSAARGARARHRQVHVGRELDQERAVESGGGTRRRARANRPIGVVSHRTHGRYEHRRERPHEVHARGDVRDRLGTGRRGLCSAMRDAGSARRGRRAAMIRRRHRASGHRHARGPPAFMRRKGNLFGEQTQHHRQQDAGTLRATRPIHQRHAGYANTSTREFRPACKQGPTQLQGQSDRGITVATAASMSARVPAR